MYIDWLKHSGAQDRQIIYIDMEDPQNESLLSYQGLYSHIKKRLCADAFSYIFIDEIQRCANCEKALEGLFIRKQPPNMGIDIYAAASGGCAFSAVPHVEIKMLPLSFAEHLLFSRLDIPGRAEELDAFSVAAPGGAAGAPRQAMPPQKPERRLPRQKVQMEKFLRQEAFSNYLSFGGFPFAAAMGGDPQLIRQCTEGIFNTVLIRDVARQTGINSIPLLENIARLMGQSTGRPLSSKKISAAISSKGRKLSVNTAEMYIKALTESLVFYHVERFDIKAGKRLKTLGKYYAADTGMRNLLPESAGETDGLLENIVCMELLRRGFHVCTGKYDSDEVNFAAFENSGDSRAAAYFQVTASARDASVLARKAAPLEKIRDDSPKYILSLDDTPFNMNYRGIVRQNLIEWLLERRAPLPDHPIA